MTGGRDAPQGRQVPCVEISAPALQRGYDHGGGVSQLCQESGALLHGAVCTCCALCQTRPKWVSAQGCTPRVPTGQGCSWLRCGALMCSLHGPGHWGDGTGGGHGGDHWGCTSPSCWNWGGVASSTAVPAAASMQQDSGETQIVVGSSTSSGGGEGHWGTLVPSNACKSHWGHTAWEPPGGTLGQAACWHWGWHGKGSELGDVPAQVLHV